MGALLGLVCMMVSKILSMVFLSMGPTLIVTLYFYQRYRTSTFKSQILYTFLEAICWMAPLMIAISLLDPVNRMILGKEVHTRALGVTIRVVRLSLNHSLSVHIARKLEESLLAIWVASLVQMKKIMLCHLRVGGTITLFIICWISTRQRECTVAVD